MKILDINRMGRGRQFMLQKIKENRLIDSKRLLNQLKISALKQIWFLSDR